jgi:DNA-binding CsgD family transcriptional regulator
MAKKLGTEDAAVAIARVGVEAPSLRAARESILALLRDVVRFDGALLHALSPRVPLDTAVVIGIDPARIEATMSSWDSFAVELAPLRDLANERLVASDAEAFPEGSKARERFVELVGKPLGVRSLVIVHLVVRGRVRAALLLTSRREGAFSREHVALLRALAPSIAAVDALHEALDDAPRASAPLELRCEDGRLTARQREIVELVAHGHTNEAIASALGLSANTLRNHLANVFARLGAANRADVVRLAVLTPR